MSEKDGELTREDYAELWKNVPPSDGTVTNIPEGATEEAAAMAEERQRRRQEYAEVWKTIPVSDTVVDIPEGATEEGAARGRLLPEDLSDEEVNRLLRDERD